MIIIIVGASAAAVIEWMSECDMLPVSYVDNDLLEETRYMYTHHTIPFIYIFAERFPLVKIHRNSLEAFDGNYVCKSVN